LLEDAAVEAALDALDPKRGDATICNAHGDLLLRNVLQTADGNLCWIDLECSGAHAEHWDLALLWVNVCDADRGAIERFAFCVDDTIDRKKQRAFYACVLFAVARERLYRSRATGADRRTRRLQLDCNRSSEVLLRA
jgi:thiamine kinase-like enzyme